MVEEEERRYAPDGGHYTYTEFSSFYGRDDEWHAADPNAQEWAPVAVGESSSDSDSDSSEDSEEVEAKRLAEKEKAQRSGQVRNGPWELDIFILHAHDLHEVGDGKATMSETNPFVVVELNNERIGKTKTKRRTRDPEYDHKFNSLKIPNRGWLAQSLGVETDGINLDQIVEEEEDEASVGSKTSSKEGKESTADGGDDGDDSSLKKKMAAPQNRDPGWEDSALKVEVYDWDRLAAHRFLGQVVVPGERLAQLIDGIRREEPIIKKKRKKDGSDDDSDSDDSDDSDSDDSDGSDDTGSSSGSSLSKKKKKPKFVVHIDHFVQEDFPLEERKEQDKNNKKHHHHSAHGGQQSYRQMRLQRIREEREALSTIVVEGTLTVRITLRCPNAKDVDSTAHQHDNALIDPHGIPKRQKVAGGAKENGEDPDLMLTPLESLFVEIDRDHVGSITKQELLRALTTDTKVSSLVGSRHFSRMGFQLLHLPRLFKEAWKIMDPLNTGEVTFPRFAKFEQHMQSTRAPNRLLLRMLYDTLLYETISIARAAVSTGKAPKEWISTSAWLRKRTIRDGLTRNRRCVRLLQRAKQFQALSYDRIFGESLMRLETSKSGYVSFDEFNNWARQLETERTERIALTKIFDALLAVDQLETDGKPIDVQPNAVEEDLGRFTLLSLFLSLLFLFFLHSFFLTIFCFHNYSSKQWSLIH
jgi:hypothetical protein